MATEKGQRKGGRCTDGWGDNLHLTCLRTVSARTDSWVRACGITSAEPISLPVALFENCPSLRSLRVPGVFESFDEPWRALDSYINLPQRAASSDTAGGKSDIPLHFLPIFKGSTNRFQVRRLSAFRTLRLS